MKSSTTRAGVWGPPLVFFFFNLVLVLGAPDNGQRAIFVAASFGTGYWLARALRVRVIVGQDSVSVHGQMRTRSYALKDLVQARVGPMRTASPFAGSFPYLALEFELTNGTTVQFGEISVREADRWSVDTIAATINRARAGDLKPG